MPGWAKAAAGGWGAGRRRHLVNTASPPLLVATPWCEEGRGRTDGERFPKKRHLLPPALFEPRVGFRAAQLALPVAMATVSGGQAAGCVGVPRQQMSSG